MNQPWFKKVKETEFFQNLPSWLKPFVGGGYAGYMIPANPTGRLVSFIGIAIIVLAVFLVTQNNFSTTSNVLIIATPLVFLVIISKIKS